MVCRIIASVEGTNNHDDVLVIGDDDVAISISGSLTHTRERERERIIGMQTICMKNPLQKKIMLDKRKIYKVYTPIELKQQQQQKVTHVKLNCCLSHSILLVIILVIFSSL